MKRAIHYVVPLALLGATASGCLPGGLITKGGRVENPGFAASASLTRGAAYKIVCEDQAELKRRETLSDEDRKGLGPAVRYVAARDYRGGCATEGESSVFFLFNLWPATDPINPDYAISTAVQRVEGDTMIHIRAWHETHYYSILGRVFVYKVRGEVIKFLTADERAALSGTETPATQKKPAQNTKPARQNTPRAAQEKKPAGPTPGGPR